VPTEDHKPSTYESAYPRTYIFLLFINHTLAQEPRVRLSEGVEE
jgi:hypothetical protein